MEKKNPICCLCGNECENEWGNNPAPLGDYKKDDRCCNKCNMEKVVPARILNLHKQEGNVQEKTTE